MRTRDRDNLILRGTNGILNITSSDYSGVCRGKAK